MLKKFFKYILLLAMIIIGMSCSQALRFSNDSDSGSRSSGSGEQVSVPAGTAPAGQVFTGKASYYGDKFHGRNTASGEVFDMNKYTAAHRTLMFGTLIKVTNLWNKKSVVVRVNDRGPFKSGRVLDLSKAAAKDLDMIAAGVVDVKVEVME